MSDTFLSALEKRLQQRCWNTWIDGGHQDSNADEYTARIAEEFADFLVGQFEASLEPRLSLDPSAVETAAAALKLMAFRQKAEIDSGLKLEQDAQNPSWFVAKTNQGTAICNMFAMKTATGEYYWATPSLIWNPNS